MDLSLKIKDIIDSKDYKLLDSIANGFNLSLLNKTSDERMKYIKSIELPDYEKIIFYLKMCESRTLGPSLILEVFTKLVSDFINNNKNSFIKLLDKEEIIDSFIIWFKNNINYRKINTDVLEEILKINKIQEKILFNIDFWNYKRPFELFNSLPKELGYLIAFYYEFDIKVYSENLEKLYNKYFSDILEEKDRINLLKEEIKLNRKTDIFHMNNSDKMIHFLHGLKQIKSDKKYYNAIMNIVDKSDLTFDEILRFAYKYDNNTFFKKLYNNDIIYNDEIIRKIKSLSNENKIIYPNLDIENNTLEELLKLPKEVSYVKMNLLGGPHATNSNKMFNDGYKSEVRRIDLSGDIKICNATVYDHERAVKELYSDIKFDEEYSSAYEKALEALRKISSITLIIENNTCLILLSNKISKEQKEALNTIMDSNNIDIKGENLFGITVYDSTTDTNSFAYDGNTVTIQDTINLINRLEIKQKGKNL